MHRGIDKFSLKLEPSDPEYKADTFSDYFTQNKYLESLI